MQEIHTGQRSTPTGAAVFKSSARPSRSKMLTNYLADIEQMLDEHNWESAVRESLDLLQIAVALADPELKTSEDLVQSWCSSWVRPLNATDDSSGLDHESLCAKLLERLEKRGATDGVPSLALRRLRLRRLTRTPPSGFNTDRVHADDAAGQDAVAVSLTIVDAVRRWYASVASRDPVVQANLGRLAVLR